MASQHRAILRIFAFHRILIPVLIGITVIGFMMAGDLSHSDLKSIRIDIQSIAYFSLAILMVIIRDIAYMYRIRLLTNYALTWRRAFQVIFLWEFSSSVTPSVVGGSAVAIFILTKEKLGTGRATATVMVTALLDEIFYIVLVPLTFLLAGFERLSVVGQNFNFLGMQLTTMGIFTLGYLLIAFITFLLAYGVFINPEGLRWLLIKVTKLRILRRFHEAAGHTGDQILEASAEFRSKSLGFWLHAALATAFSWTARFMVVNFLIAGFTYIPAIGDHLLIMARQLMMWVIMLVSPTPGGSGIAEFFFPVFLREFIAGTERDITMIVALAWRLLTYYPYLIIGALVLPFWLKRVYLGRKLIKFRRAKSKEQKS
ncbi:MAG TPA: lysylphosphatidylglycerol synthase transmembrane domain-containing protein [Lentimicrobium sp.]|nr:lysylphosphatidylglycerol synthase transmembrane domain-containing protein [Lentimicrobium sp.]